MRTLAVEGVLLSHNPISQLALRRNKMVEEPKTTKYVITNQSTQKSTEIDIPSIYDNTEVINLVLEDKPDNLNLTTPDEQRPIDPLHLNSLDKSIRGYTQLYPGMVDGYARNIEGGHRYRCAEMNNTPYNFIVNLKPELGLEDLIREINTNQQNWVLEDYLQKGIQTNNPSYVMLDRLMEQHKMRKINTWITMLSNRDGSNELQREFKRGDFNPTKDMWDNALNIMNEINSLGEYFKYTRNHYFITAYIRISSSKYFDYEIFKRKFSKFGDLQEKNNSDNYVAMFNEIWNRGLQTIKKRFLA